MGNRYLGTGLAPELIEIVRNKAKSLIARKYFTSDDFDDLQQELFIVLWQAMQAYRQERKEITNERAFAQHVLNNRAENLITNIKAKKRAADTSTISLHDFIGEDDNYLLIDNIEENYTFDEDREIDFTERIDFDLDLQTIINKLPGDLQEIYKLSQLMSFDEIAKLKNVSRTTIYAKKQLLKRKISNFIKNGARPDNS